MFSAPTLYCPTRPVRRPPAVDRHRHALLRARSAGCRTAPARRRRQSVDAAERERVAVLEKELALLGEEQAEPRQVDLLLVGLDLREIGVVGEVRGQVLRDAVLHVEPHVAVEVVRDRRRRVRSSSASTSRTA